MPRKGSRKKLTPDEKEDSISLSYASETDDKTLEEVSYVNDKKTRIDRLRCEVPGHGTHVYCEQRIHIEHGCGKELEQELATRFDALPLTALSMGEGEQTPQMKLVPIDRVGPTHTKVNAERLMTLRPIEGASAQRCVRPEFDIFPAGMCLCLALESIERARGMTLDELADDPGDPEGKGDFNDEQSALRAAAVLVVELCERRGMPTPMSIATATEALAPFAYRQGHRTVPALFTVTGALSGFRNGEYGGIYCKFDAIYYSLLFFSGTLPKRCKYCGRPFFPDHGNEEYCSFNCPGADGLTCAGGGVKRISDADLNQFKKKADGTYDNIIKRLDSKSLLYDVDQVRQDFLITYDEKRSELFMGKDRPKPWKKYELLYDWLEEYNKNLGALLEEAKRV